MAGALQRAALVLADICWDDAQTRRRAAGAGAVEALLGLLNNGSWQQEAGVLEAAAGALADICRAMPGIQAQRAAR